jgi:integrase
MSAVPGKIDQKSQGSPAANGHPRKIAFTDKALKALRPIGDGPRGQPVYDIIVPGLCVRVGARSPVFYVTKRDPIAKKFRWIRLGHYPVMAVSEARERAREVLKAVTESRSIPPAPIKGASSFAAVAEKWIAECLPAKRSSKASEQLIRRELLPALGARPITSVTHEDIVTLLNGIADRSARHRGGDGHLKSGGPHAARKALAELSPLLKWAAFHRHGGLQTNPAAAISVKELMRGRRFNKARDRILTDTELRFVWQAASATPYPVGPLVCALILSGQRRDEIARARWSEIDDGTGCLVIPAERMKAKAAHALPLTERMRELFARLPRFEGGDDFIFTTTGGQRPISGFSKWKDSLDRSVAAIGEVDPWRFQDLRRTMRTGLSRVQVAPFFAELAIAHTQKGVHATYDLHRYRDEVAAALGAWESLLFDQILKELPANVVKLAAVG